jgi:glycosyltransferase involved in cell wall biosynthesis
MNASASDKSTLEVQRVLHVFLYFQPDFSGEGLYFEKIAPLLAGIRSDVVVAASTSEPARRPLGPGIDEVHRFVAKGEILPWYNWRLVIWFLMHAWRYDVVHFHCFVDRLFLLHIIARLSGCRIVQSATLDDGLGMVVDGYRASRRWLVRRMCRLIHHAVAISPRLFEDSLRTLSKGRVSLIPQGVAIKSSAAQPSQRTAARAALGFAPDDIVLLFVGGICARKDITFLLDAMPVAIRSAARVRLLVVGPDLECDYAASVRRRAASLGDGVVRFTGFVEDPSPAYLAADVFVFASRAEGFGNVLIEAMAAGLPVLARHLPGVTDSFISDGATGFLFSDAVTYDEILARLIADAVLRQRVGQAARASVAGYDMAAIAARYIEVYRNEAPMPAGNANIPFAAERNISDSVADRAR